MLTQQDIKVIETIVEEKLDKKTRLLPTKDEFFTKMDEVVGELKAIREEHALQGNTLSNHTDQLENHDKRVKNLEERLVTAA
ncbi:hypothetical protein A3A64_03070 [Candidatus Gottesmanbacteria bacterium RIFCSPLOWO2_01_FULL_48_11]|uniref:Uncharacterized protein n=2 Tax=Candidatus Gottesmaniibacteriota TaxID=1752720 RepID=A0A0G1TVE6_9BACT|nr:MAG: hypothetical protein UY16_C0070G0008 [Candidatus Gottesmanbacteria bacterium GW2011_GWA2_47_9]OGG27584.1 MAG: hypothetical protein A3A64_03070 [Candidatus Gottesmanbacteria bacterium RIFCSPLOWO2_01_FULL_48_11]